MLNNLELLLNDISDDLNIRKGDTEENSSFIRRLIYSAVIRTAYNSLFDFNENNDIVSIKHFKAVLQDLLKFYFNQYGDVFANVASDEVIAQITDEYYDLLLSSGIIYHYPHRITASKYQCFNYDDISFVRGYSYDETIYMSGAGAFIETNGLIENTVETIFDYFQIPTCLMSERWRRRINKLKFVTSQNENKYEYIKTNKFKDGYWGDQPINDGTVSILKNSTGNSSLYYFYKFDGEELLVSQIPEWLSEGNEIYILVNEFLFDYGKLPYICFKEDGEIVIVKLNYILPPKELAAYKLYSWPDKYLDNDFQNRIMNIKVFKIFRYLLENEGYKFERI